MWLAKVSRGWRYWVRRRLPAPNRERIEGIAAAVGLEAEHLDTPSKAEPVEPPEPRKPHPQLCERP